MPRSVTLNETTTDALLSIDPASQSRRRAAYLVDTYSADEGIQERVLAGDHLLERWLGDLAARADGVDPNQPLDLGGVGSIGLGVRRSSIQSDWEREDDQREDDARSAKLDEAQAGVDALNKRAQSLTELGWDDSIAFDIAKRGEEETRRCKALDPAAYALGNELERGQGGEP